MSRTYKDMPDSIAYRKHYKRKTKDKLYYEHHDHNYPEVGVLYEVRFSRITYNIDEGAGYGERIRSFGSYFQMRVCHCEITDFDSPAKAREARRKARIENPSVHIMRGCAVYPTHRCQPGAGALRGYWKTVRSNQRDELAKLIKTFDGSEGLEEMDDTMPKLKVAHFKGDSLRGGYWD